MDIFGLIDLPLGRLVTLSQCSVILKAMKCLYVKQQSRERKIVFV